MTDVPPQNNLRSVTYHVLWVSQFLQTIPHAVEKVVIYKSRSFLEMLALLHYQKD